MPVGSECALHSVPPRSYLENEPVIAKPRSFTLSLSMIGKSPGRPPNSRTRRECSLQKLMRHAHVSTAMDQYGNASALAKRKANRPIVQRLLKRPTNQQVSIQ
jgi:hypothetical protein